VLAQGTWCAIARVLVAALGYRVGRGYRQPQLILEFRNLRLGLRARAAAAQRSRA
jgi:hypothetical protein